MGSHQQIAAKLQLVLKKLQDLQGSGSWHGSTKAQQSCAPLGGVGTERTALAFAENGPR